MAERIVNGSKNALTPQPPSNRSWRPYAASLLLALFSLANFHFGRQAVAEFFTAGAEAARNRQAYAEALRRLETAQRFPHDTARVHRLLGEVCHQRSTQAEAPKDQYRFALQAKNHFLKAANADPLDPEPPLNAARQETRLESLFAQIPFAARNNPHNADALYQAALDAFPYGVAGRVAYLEYVRKQNHPKLMAANLRRLLETYPPVYYEIQNIVPWDTRLRHAAVAGLETALSHKLYPLTAHRVLSDLWTAEQQWAKAIYHYQAALFHAGRKLREQDAIELGRLYLNSGQDEKAREHFLTGLMGAAHCHQRLRQIFSWYQARDELEMFCKLCDQFRGHSDFSPETEAIFAQALLELNSNDAALNVLKAAAAQESHPEIFALLGKIAEQRENWPAMAEAFSQAIEMNPANGYYHQKLSQALRSQGQWLAAEKAADRSIQTMNHLNPWFFSNRAVIRQKLKNTTGAVEDWRAAIRIQPDAAYFHAGLAKSLFELNRIPESLHHYEKAHALRPETPLYRLQLEQLRVRLRR